MGTSKVSAVTRVWRSLLRKIEQKGLSLVRGDEIEMWSFKNVTGELCFMLVMADSRRRAVAPEKEVVGNKMRLKTPVAEEWPSMKGNRSSGAS
ncbi:unnamed protein product [Linum tenue]|uniref:Uncharacterized protein n=1 Tax=Linum tenue TaxID=586396 RepID=A0AAV0HKL8_9ROSI|nr:unnamed protein product [Linum tenue]